MSDYWKIDIIFNMTPHIIQYLKRRDKDTGQKRLVGVLYATGNSEFDPSLKDSSEDFSPADRWYTPEKEPRVFGFGFSYCSGTGWDTFDKKLGREIAEGRARKMLHKARHMYENCDYQNLFRDAFVRFPHAFYNNRDHSEQLEVFFNRCDKYFRAQLFIHDSLITPRVSILDTWENYGKPAWSDDDLIGTKDHAAEYQKAIDDLINLPSTHETDL